MSGGKRIGLIGCGEWGKLILRDLVELGCDVTAVARSDPSRANAAAKGATIVASVEELPPQDGLVVATPSVTHAEVLDSLVDRGEPIFVEKPLTTDAAAAIRLVQRAGEWLFVMDKWRYHLGVLAIANIARSGELGAVVGLKTRRLGWGHPHPDADCAWILLPHDLAMALEILGEIPTPRHAVTECDASGELHGMLVLGDTARGWHMAEIGVRSMDRRRSVELLCERGTATLLDAYSEEILIVPNPRARKHGPLAVERRPIGSAMPLRAELAAFLAYLDGGPPPRSSAAEGARNVQAIAEARALAGLDPAAGQKAAA